MSTTFSFEHRKTIEKLYNKNTPVTQIAAALGCNRKLVYVELHRGFTGRLDKNIRKGYSAEIGQKVYDRNCRRNGFNQAT